MINANHQFSTDVINATRTYLLRAQRIERPEGKADGAGRWYPAGRDAEVMADVRGPSVSFPLSYFTACQSIKHCAALHDADPKLVKRLAKLVREDLEREVWTVRATIEKCLMNYQERQPALAISGALACS